jgi:hypothetical protein
MQPAYFRFFWLDGYQYSMEVKGSRIYAYTMADQYKPLSRNHPATKKAIQLAQGA